MRHDGVLVSLALSNHANLHLHMTAHLWGNCGQETVVRKLWSGKCGNCGQETVVRKLWSGKCGNCGQATVVRKLWSGKCGKCGACCLLLVLVRNVKSLGAEVQIHNGRKLHCLR